MIAQPRRRLAILVVAIAMLVAIASAAGILLRGPLATEPWTTVRGEQLDIVTDGVYAWNSLPVVSEGIGWDVVSLILAAPALLLAAIGIARGSLRSTLVGLGLLVYVLYQYAMYAMFWAIGPLYPLHLGLIILSVSALAILVTGLDPQRVSARVDDRFPRRAVTGLGVFMVVVLCGLWLPTIWRVVVEGQVQDLLNGGVTLVVPAFDLGFLVPLGAFTAITAWRRSPMGYVLATTVVVKAVAMATAIVAMLAVEWGTTGVAAVFPMALFGGTALAALAIGIRVYASIGADAPRRPGLTLAESRA
jgi:hypothetical protein